MEDWKEQFDQLQRQMEAMRSKFEEDLQNLRQSMDDQSLLPTFGSDDEHDEPDMPIIAKIGAAGSGAYANMFAWQEAGMNANAPVVLTSGGYTVAASQPGSAIPLAAGYTILFPFHNAKAQFVMLPLAPQFVLVKNNGGGGGTSTTTINATYDLYALSDTSYTTKLNTAGALSPAFNRAELSPPTTPVATATDGSVGLAYYDASGAIQLWSCLETPTWKTC